MEHLTFDEIVAAVYTEKLNPESTRLIARVNAHVMKCPDCFKTYKAIYEIYELGFEQGLDVVEERLKEIENESLTDSQVHEIVKKYIMQMALSIENKKQIVMNDFKNLSMLHHYYSYPTSVATRGGNQKLDMSKLIDDENIDNVIEYKDGFLKLQFSKFDYDDNGMKYPLLEVLSGKNVLYDGPFDEDDVTLYKNINLDNNYNVAINLKEHDV